MMGNFEATLDTGQFEFKCFGDILSQMSSVYNSSYFHDMTCNQIELYLYALLNHYPHFTVESNYKMQGNCLWCWAFTLGNSYKVTTLNVEQIILTLFTIIWRFSLLMLIHSCYYKVYKLDNTQIHYEQFSFRILSMFYSWCWVYAV